MTRTERRKNKRRKNKFFFSPYLTEEQAVSKWENEVAMPDVTLIPAIASFFDVSTDDLFDYNRLEMERKVQDICERAVVFRENNPKKSEEILREGLRQFPGNEVILNNLLYTMEVSQQGEEMITICKTLIEGAHEDDVRYDAVRILANIYHECGRQDLVEPTLQQIPEIYFTKLEQTALLCEGDLALDAAKKHLRICVRQMMSMLEVIRMKLDEKGKDAEKSKYEKFYRAIGEASEEIL